MALIAPQSVLPDILSHHRGRYSLSKHEIMKRSVQNSNILATSAPSGRHRQHSSSRRSFRCAAVTGGSKRDVEKIVAKTQHRRPRHLKGMTPSKTDLLEELEEEEGIEEDVENEVAQLLSEDSTLGSSENLSGGSNNGSSEGTLENDAQTDKNDLRGGDKPDSENPPVSNAVYDGAQSIKGVLEATEDTAMDVVDTAAGTQKQLVSDAMKGGESLVGIVSDAISEESSSSSSDSEKELSDDIGDSARAIADVSSATAADVGTTVNETGQQVRQDIREVASNIGDTTSSQTRSALDNFNEQASEVQDSVNAVANVTMDTTSYVSKKVGETAEQVGQDLSEVVATGQRLVQDSSKAMNRQAEDITSQGQKTLEEEGSLLEQGATRIQREASKSLGRAQNSVQKAVQESARAARSVGMEVFGMGELLVDVTRETVQGASAITQDKGMQSGVKRSEKENGSLTEDSKTQVSQQEETSRFTDFKVLVAGASGQTGRLLVENLLSKGASVRAMVRDVYKARSIPQLKDCECIEGDLYNYEAVRRALGDSNVVICAIGVRAFPFDPLNTFQVEYEGVVNLISAAKNQGKVKKFILISTVGVTYLQLVPLIFWKKQAELYLQRSGLDYTIVRPGGLRNTSGPEEVIMQSADSQFFGGISRKKVAEVCASALVSSDASHKIVEVVSVPGSQKRSIVDLFRQI